SSALRTAVEGRQVTCMQTTYHLMPTVLESCPIRGTPWSLILFSHTRPAVRWLAETLSTAFGFFVLYLLVLIILLVATQRITGKKRPGEARALWYWPRDEF